MPQFYIVFEFPETRIVSIFHLQSFANFKNIPMNIGVILLTFCQ